MEELKSLQLCATSTEIAQLPVEICINTPAEAIELLVVIELTIIDLLVIIVVV